MNFVVVWIGGWAVVLFEEWRGGLMKVKVEKKLVHY